MVKPNGILVDTSDILELLNEISPECRPELPTLPAKYKDYSGGRGTAALLSNSEDGEEQEPEPSWPVNYFLVSQTFHREASAVFFGENEFHLNHAWSPSLRGKHDRSNAGKHGYHKHLDSLRRMRRVVLHAGRLGGVLEGLFIPVLREIALSGGLKRLDVRVSPSVQKAGGPAGLWGSSPGRSLLGLLRDPDLEAARLRVDHLPFNGRWVVNDKGEIVGVREGEDAAAPWCPRRKGPDDRLVTMVDWEGRMWCDLDIEELARRYGGGEVGIFKVGEKPLLR